MVVRGRVKPNAAPVGVVGKRKFMWALSPARGLSCVVHYLNAPRLVLVLMVEKRLLGG